MHTPLSLSSNAGVLSSWACDVFDNKMNAFHEWNVIIVNMHGVFESNDNLLNILTL